MEEYKKGDWVRFMMNGALVIGEVAYADLDRYNRQILYTSAGMVNGGSVLEVRHA